MNVAKSLLKMPTTKQTMNVISLSIGGLNARQQSELPWRPAYWPQEVCHLWLNVNRNWAFNLGIRASTPDASQGDMAQALTPHPGLPGPNENDTTLGSPFTPTSHPSPAIDPSILDTPELDSSMLTQPSPSVPQTPGAPGPSIQHGSLLSNVSDDDTPAQRTEEITLKRKRCASKIDWPKARPKRKAAQA